MKSMEKGVFTIKQKNGETVYRASLTYKSKHISLGSYRSEKEAAKAYEEGLSVINSTVPFDENARFNVLPFDKYIILVNFRDNNLYIHNPIYIFKKYFKYYLSKENIYIFDTDDLFYYSSHKIQVRGGHLFVSDFGMQVSVLSRYGIWSFAREGKDYFFNNGDSKDLRYENIRVVLPYRGITIINKKGKILYKTKIHIKSSIVVGIYDSPEKAAIAYNKAIDVLIKNGFKSRNFMPNYIDDLSPKDYAGIYIGLKISEKILQMTP